MGDGAGAESHSKGTSACAGVEYNFKLRVQVCRKLLNQN